MRAGGNKTVKLTIPIEFLSSETDKALNFNTRTDYRGAYINLPKSQIKDFKRVIVKLYKWNDSRTAKCLSFRIPVWCYIRNAEAINKFKKHDIIIELFKNNKT